MSEAHLAPSATEAPAPKQPHRARWLWWAGGAVVLAGAFGAGALADRAQDARTERDRAEPSAWDERQELEQVLPDTAQAVGLPGDIEADPYGPFQCVRNDGRQGFAYSLAKVQSPAVENVPALLEQVEQHWDDLGYDAQQGQFAGAPAVTAMTERGSQLRVIAGPQGTGFAGETGCFLTDGRPG